MALSGSGGAYYRGVSLGGTNLHNINTMHIWFKPVAAPSGADFQIMACLVGGGPSPPQQNPHESLVWNHSTAGFQKARQHRVAAGGYVANQMATTPASNVWHPLTATFDGTLCKIYCDGNLEGTSAATSPSANQTVFFDILGQMTYAGALDASSEFHGYVAEAALWPEVLGADDIRALAKGYRPILIRPQTILRYARFIRDLQEIRAGSTYIKQAGSEVYGDHPPMIG